MNSLDNIIGELCKVIFPIHEESFLGNADSTIAVCTLSSITLLKKFANSDIMNNISIVGRLLSENNGIDAIIKYLNQNKKISTLVVCGTEVWGHKAGDSLLQLHINGVDDRGRIINSTSPNPFLTVTRSEVTYFQNRINLINMIEETNFELIKQQII